MPEYLAPGVYVEEYDANPQPIPGVSTSIDGATARSLIDRFKDLVPPDWTGYNESDPGITLVKLSLGSLKPCCIELAERRTLAARPRSGSFCRCWRAARPSVRAISRAR